MLERLIDACLRHRVFVLLVAAASVLAGLMSLSRLPFDAFPDTTPVQVQINATAPAMSPVEIERQLAFPIEQSVSGLPGLREVRSVSKFGFTQVTAIFDEGTDIRDARQFVGERLATVDLPAGTPPPSMGPLTSGLGEVFQYVLHSETLSTRELRTLHHWVIRPQMLQVQGVAEVNTWGGEERQFHVVIDPRALLAYGLDLDDLARLLSESNRNVGGGALETQGETLLVQGQGLVRTLDELRDMVVASVDGTNIHLSDVAELREDHEIRRGAVTYMGQGEAVLGLGFMLMGENSRALTQRLEARLEEVRKRLPAEAQLETVYSRSDLVDRVLDTVRTNLLEGALLVIAILFVFLGNLRAGLIVALAIPLSMLFAFNAMLQFGVAGSLMSLGAIDFGLVVDSSVIMVENASHRLAEDRSERSVREVVRDAALEVRRPTLYGELVIASVYLPILLLEGVEGKLFRPMALTVIFALAASMVISLTLMPVLASYALRRKRAPRKASVSRADQRVRRAYGRLLDWALRRRKPVLLAALVALLGAGTLATRLGTEFVPRLNEGAIAINTVRIPGVALDESIRYGSAIEARLLAAFPDEIDKVWTRTGTAEVATDPMGLEVSDLFVTLTPRTQWRRASTQAELVESMKATLEGLPGMRSIFTQPIEMRLNEVVAGIRADVGIKIFGEDFEALEAAAEKVRARVESIPGAADVTVEALSGQGTLSIEVDREAAGRYGIEVGELLGWIESLGTRKVGEVFEGQRRFDLVLRVDESSRSSLEALRAMPIQSHTGAQVPLSAVATIELLEGPSTIQREWASRRVVVQANVRGRDIGSFVADLRRELDAVELPPGYYTRLGGQFEHLERAQKRLWIVVPLSLLLVFTLLYATYGRTRDALRVFIGVPFAAVGGIAALWLRELPFSISAGVGFVALFGVAVLGDMVLVSQIRRLRGAGRPALEAVREAAQTRLRPVLMTAMVAAFGFIPMAFNTGIGAEVQRPLATVVIGGILTSTLATLLVMPLLYVGRREES